MSAHDLAIFLAALDEHSSTPLLKPETLRAMRVPVRLPGREKTTDYGLGMVGYQNAWGHTGTLEDVRNFALDLPNGYTVVVLAATRRVGSGRSLIAYFANEIAALAALPDATAAR